MNKLRLMFTKIEYLFCVFWIVVSALIVSAQSTSSENPTPITSNEISGKIRARDIGDARLTSYYYVFNGTQGDVFINVTASNLNGDIDIFAAEGLRPLSKISLYADNSPTETGRIVYLRQPSRLILRVEGRSPDDNPATFTIKFAGSFAAIEGATTPEVSAPKVENTETGAVRVNSVGTIIQTPTVKKEPEKKVVAVNPPTKPKKTVETKPQNSVSPKVVVTDEIANDAQNKSDSEIANETAKTKVTTIRPKRSETRPKPVKPSQSDRTITETKPAAPNPLENVRLVVMMKDGSKVEYPMTTVFRFALNNNVLTIILKDGKIERRSIFDIQKFSVE